MVCFNWVQGFRHFFTNKPIRSAEDLAGLRIRTPPAPIWQESVRALGAAPAAMAFGEMYPGLQQKAIDGVELVYDNIPAGRFYEVLKYVNETGHILLINFQVISAQWFNSLPAEYQRILVEECDRAGLEFFLPDHGEYQRRARAGEGPRDDHRDGRRQRGVPQGAGEAAYARLGLLEVREQIYAQLRAMQ